MADLSRLRSDISEKWGVKSNNKQAITGDKLKNALLDIIDTLNGVKADQTDLVSGLDKKADHGAIFKDLGRITTYSWWTEMPTSAGAFKFLNADGEYTFYIIKTETQSQMYSGVYFDDEERSEIYKFVAYNGEIEWRRLINDGDKERLQEAINAKVGTTAFNKSIKDLTNEIEKQGESVAETNQKLSELLCGCGYLLQYPLLVILEILEILDIYGNQQIYI